MGLLLDILLFVGLAYYLMTNLQWYNYSLGRVLSKHHKRRWHLLYFLLPLFLYCVAGFWRSELGSLLVVLLYLPALFFWASKLDHRLKYTARVWRFVGILAICFVLAFLLHFAFSLPHFGCFALAFILSFVFSHFLESFLFFRYKKLAQAKLASMPALKIVLITASYGKTSIKNYLTQILKARFFAYCTPRSVNTLKGIVSDINENLQSQTEFYIVEAGARQRGDIAEIAEFLNPHFVIIGKIGPQHLEYFGSLENILETKYEALRSTRLRYALSYALNPLPSQANPKLALSTEPTEIQAGLGGTGFTLMLEGEKQRFETAILGGFNAYNIALCLQMALQMGMKLTELKARIQKLQNSPHRLSKSEAGGKIILDDSFNGNLEGMQEAIRIASEHQGRRVIVTPGVIEGTEAMNIELAHSIDAVFEVAILTGELNVALLSTHIRKAQKIVLKDKSQMENALKACLREGDLVLFANDAPNYI